jgi:Tol biopolymer transport system component
MSRVQYVNALWLFGGLLAGCGEDLTAPDRGAIEVTSRTVGDPTDPDGYTLAVDGGEDRALGPNSTLTVPGLLTGDHELTLGGMASNCVLTGANPRMVSVTSGATARTTFELTCSTATGSIELTTATTGENLDTDGYLATLDGAPGRPIESNGAITFAGVTAGSHMVILTGVAPNCAVGGENPRTVAVGIHVASIRFEITCGPPTGSILISTATAGSRPDLDGYAASVDGSAEQAIASNGTLTFPGLPLGDHSVLLTDVAANCAVDGDNPRTVTVSNGQQASVAFQVSCFATGTGRILFASDRTGTSHLYSVRENGSNIIDLTPTMEAFDGDWSPDRSRIVFATTRDEEPSIFVMDADGSNPVGLGTAGTNPRWSPDGRKILWSDGTIRVMDADGSRVVDLTAGNSPDWSPNGTQIAFSRTDQSRCVGLVFFRFCPADIYVMAADGSQIRRLTTSSDPSDQATGPTWSPDGTGIAYARRCCFLGPNENGLWVISPNGGSPSRIDSHLPVGRPVWSPDGSAIAFADRQPDGTTQLTVIPSTGGAAIVLASSPAFEYPTSWR